MAASPSRSSPPEPPLLQDEVAVAAESTHVPDRVTRAATTRTTEAAKPIHHMTSLVMRTSSPAVRYEYAQPGDWSISPTPPPVAGVGHGSEPPWLIHLTGSTRAASSVSRTRTVAMVAPRVNRGQYFGRSARSGASLGAISATPDVLSCRGSCRWWDGARRRSPHVRAYPGQPELAQPQTVPSGRAHAGGHLWSRLSPL